MADKQTTDLIRSIRRAQGEEETILGDNPEAYLENLRKDPARVLKLLQKAGIYDQDGNLTARYR